MPRKIPIQSILPHTRSHITVRRIASCARLYRQRQLDYLAPFRRPANPPYSPLNDKLQNVLQTHGQPAASPEGDVAYETASTAPVATSLQEVPRHEEASRLVDPLPAMKDASGAEEEHSKEKMKARTKEMIVQGISVPPKPIPPGEEECCMSGCVNCVYTVYSDDLQGYVAALDAAREALEAAHIPKTEWPDEVAKQGRGEDVKGEEVQKTEDAMDPAMNAFFALENKLKKKQAPESSAAS
ncbi:hypothetical protein C343_05584 [Cryptococcus neoformans C23]|uniref:Oxidoreductase-like domain-containing protein n=2 Tax=Cryptococcus neoformans TaxID=5207 RepID=A0A854Q441_CRYNE|nr:hypothetical protein CNAG_04775 [Cryptococcus neoformans var. grubii H99]AUB27466.1 hypothetical protein CKF44_04775 [Cryptococcus neoformans var. grubii]OWZ28416.1 hypothetical protein C347_05622 [Cryptococcus neoformans var. grubii AD2-60a]OWZ40363.1 hypothetical protein C343_05584 [Cryptococcus neoformans var. grubii C23]OXC82436.1 hypothetical protein C344_05306 [Cryptococcus neoformans var. grubii AD1-7a]OXG13697.1 hypothetical protein C361_05837 [Cryptococcus neoformans var. grubii Tu|eukprot:XP_012052198.1 hypothetical protein CNAG_04775 [Cryptococcus neoformans var. grubii H99]